MLHVLFYILIKLVRIWVAVKIIIIVIIIIMYKKVAKIAFDYDMLESSRKVYEDMNWLPLHLRRQLHMTTYICLKS